MGAHTGMHRVIRTGQGFKIGGSDYPTVPYYQPSSLVQYQRRPALVLVLVRVLPGLPVSRLVTPRLHLRITGLSYLL